MLLPLTSFSFSSNWNLVIETSGGFWWVSQRYLPFKKRKKRSREAALYIEELEEKILETGVVRNPHKPYHPRYNKRYPVSERRAARIAYMIAKRQGYDVGKYRGPNVKQN